MAITNNNPIIRIDDDSVINSSFIRIVAFNGLDTKENETTIDVQFAFYLSRSKWLENWQKNALRVKGVNVISISVNYQRSIHGADVMAHLYTELVKYLLSVMPDWGVEKLTFELA